MGSVSQHSTKTNIMKTLVFLGVIAVALGAPHAVLPATGLVGAVAHHGLVGTHAVGYTTNVGVAHHVVQPAPQQYAVALPPKEVKVPITKQHVTIPVHQKTHYGTQTYVAGSTTAIHKPSLSAPAIAPPSVLLSKVTHNAPEVTVKTQEVKVEKNVPNFVDTPYHAGTIVKYTEPQINEVKVPTPVAKPVAVPVQVPYAQPVPVPHPVPVHAGTQYHHHAAVGPVTTGAVVAPTAYAGHSGVIAGHGLVAGQGLIAGHGLVAGHGGLVAGHGLIAGHTLPVAAAVAEE